MDTKRKTKKRTETRGTKPGVPRGPYKTRKTPLTPVSVLVPVVLRDALKAEAAAQDITLNALCRKKLSRDLKT